MEPIYLDHAATTPMRPEVRAAMEPFLTDQFGNPASTHAWGRAARSALEEARERVAAALGARRNEIVFTGSGTEADNLAVLGRVRAARRSGAGTAAVCSAIEHRGVLAPVRASVHEGGQPILLAVDGEGRVDIAALEEALAARPAVVSVMWGNNEVGTLQPVPEIAERCRAAGVAFHSDAVQAFGKVRVRVDEVPVDLLSLSAHKLGGPRGVGALFVRSGVELEPVLVGGGQESGLRSGTVNVAGAVGLAAAAELTAREAQLVGERLAALRARFEHAVIAALPDATVLAGGAERLPQISSLWLERVDREALLMSLDLEGIAVSAGSACQSGGVEPSHVLVALGRDGATDAAAVRISFGWTTTDHEVDRASASFVRVVQRVRALAAETAGV